MNVNVEFLMAARGRLVYEKQTTLTGALLAKKDDDPLVVALEEAFDTYYGNKVNSPLDTLELMIAERVDDGETLPISNPEGYAAARWIVQLGIATLPETMPRAFALYFARALKENGQSTSMKESLETLINTKTFTHAEETIT